MAPPDRRPPPLPPANSAKVDAVVGAAKGAAASQDHVRPELARKGTLPGMPALKPPGLPPGLAPTRPAPPNPLRHQTFRAPTPPEVLAAARRSEPPTKPDNPMPHQLESNAPPSDSEPPRGRGRQGSHPDLVDHRLHALERGHEKLEAAVPRIEVKVGAIDGKMAGIEKSLADLNAEVKVAAARTSSETVKIIVAGVVTVVTAVVGARVTAPEQKATTVEVHKSEAELESEVCRKLPDEQQRAICLTGVLNRLIEPPKR